MFEKDDEKLKNKKLYNECHSWKVISTRNKEGVYFGGLLTFIFFFSSGGYTLFFVFVCFNLYHHCHITFQGTLQIGCSLLQIFVVYFLLLFFFTNNGKFKIEITTFQYVVKMIIFFILSQCFGISFSWLGKKVGKKILVAQCSSWYCCTKKWRYVWEKREPNLTCHFFLRLKQFLARAFCFEL